MIKVYTDGGFRTKYSLGAYAYVIIKSEEIIESYSVAVPISKNLKVTNNTMEMNAVIKALTSLLKNHKNELSKNDVYLMTDSQYVQLGLLKWYPNWKNNGWKSVNGKPIKNFELWQKLYDLYMKVSIISNSFSIQWVESHSNNPMNETVDKMCNKAMDAFILNVDKDEI